MKLVDERSNHNFGFVKSVRDGRTSCIVSLTLRASLINNLTVAAEGVAAEVAALAAILAAGTACSSAGLSRKKFVARNLGDLLISHVWHSSGNADDGGNGEDSGNELHVESWLMLLVEEGC